MILFGAKRPGGDSQYPDQRPRRPQTVELEELFPVGKQPRPMLGLALLRLRQADSVQLEMLIILGSNVVMSGADPKRLVQALEKVPFVVALGDRLDETLECADLILATAQGLERLDFPVNRLEGWVTGRHWYFTARLPAVEPPPDVRHTVDIFMEWADRLGLRPELNQKLNAELGLSESERSGGRLSIYKPRRLSSAACDPCSAQTTTSAGSRRTGWWRGQKPVRALSARRAQAAARPCLLP